MYSDNLSAIQAAGGAMSIIAHNLANMNTDGYRAANFIYTSGHGDMVEARYHPSAAPLPASPPAPAQPAREPLPEGFAAAGYTADAPFPYGGELRYAEVDIAREMTAMMQAEHLLTANAVTVVSRATTGDTVLGLVVDRRA